MDIMSLIVSDERLIFMNQTLFLNHQHYIYQQHGIHCIHHLQIVFQDFQNRGNGERLQNDSGLQSGITRMKIQMNEQHTGPFYEH